MKTPQDLERKFYELLGRIVVKFGHLESVLQSLISHLANGLETPIVLLIVKDNTFAKNAELIRQLGYARTTPEHPLWNRIESLAEKLKLLSEKRNRYIHARWDVDISRLHEKGVIKCHTPKLKAKGKGEWSVECIKVTLKMLEDDSKEIWETFVETQTLVLPIIAHLKTLEGWQKKQLRPFTDC